MVSLKAFVLGACVLPWVCSIPASAQSSGNTEIALVYFSNVPSGGWEGGEATRLLMAQATRQLGRLRIGVTAGAGEIHGNVCDLAVSNCPYEGRPWPFGLRAGVSLRPGASVDPYVGVAAGTVYWSPRHVATAARPAESRADVQTGWGLHAGVRGLFGRILVLGELGVDTWNVAPLAGVGVGLTFGGS